MGSLERARSPVSFEPSLASLLECIGVDAQIGAYHVNLRQKTETFWVFMEICGNFPAQTLVFQLLHLSFETHHSIVIMNPKTAVDANLGVAVCHILT